MLEDENLLKTAVQDTITGATLGASLGTVGAKIQHNIRKKKLDELVDKRKDWGVAFTRQSGKPAEAIDKLLEQKKGFVPKATSKKGIGDIDFVWGKGGKKGYGLSHVIDRRNSENIDGVEFVKSIPDIIEKGTVKQIANQPNIKPIQSGEDSALIKKVWDYKNRQWVVTAFRDNSTPNKFNSRTPDITINSSEMTPSANLLRDSSIIPSVQQNFNTGLVHNVMPKIQSQIKTPKSFNNWLEELKRRRKKLGL